MKVSQKVVDQMRAGRMAENIAKANSGKASAEFVEAARRFYGKRIKAPVGAATSDGSTKATRVDKPSDSVKALVPNGPALLPGSPDPLEGEHWTKSFKPATSLSSKIKGALTNTDLISGKAKVDPAAIKRYRKKKPMTPYTTGKNNGIT